MKNQPHPDSLKWVEFVSRHAEMALPVIKMHLHDNRAETAVLAMRSGQPKVFTPLATAWRSVQWNCVPHDEVMRKEFEMCMNVITRALDCAVNAYDMPYPRPAERTAWVVAKLSCALTPDAAWMQIGWLQGLFGWSVVDAIKHSVANDFTTMLDITYDMWFSLRAAEQDAVRVWATTSRIRLGRDVERVMEYAVGIDTPKAWM